MPGWLKWLLRLGVVALAGYLLVRSGALDWRVIKGLRLTPGGAAVMVGCVFGVALLNAWRWRIILAGAGLPAKLFHLFRLTLIGYFYNLVMPGGMGGDLAKAVYVAKEHPEGRALAGSSVAVDRLLGVLSLLIVALVGLLLLALAGGRSTDLFRLAGLIGAALVLAGAGVWLAGWVLKRPRLAGLRIRGFALAELIKVWPTGRAMLKAAGISFTMHILSVIILVTAGRVVGYETGFLVWLVVGPVTIVLNQLPISPGGLGVGELVMFSLLTRFSAVPGVNPGAVVFMIFRLAFYVLSAAGAAFLFVEPDRRLKGGHVSQR